jgi:hypothetical protein
MFEKQGKFFSADLFCEAKRDFVDGWKIVPLKQSIYRKVAPGRLFTFKFLLFSLDIKNCNPSQWRHSIVCVHPMTSFFSSPRWCHCVFQLIFSRLLKIWKWHHSWLYIPFYIYFALKSITLSRVEISHFYKVLSSVKYLQDLCQKNLF